MSKFHKITALTVILFLSACSLHTEAQSTFPDVDKQSLLRDVQILSSDALEGRKTGEVGNLMARVYLEERFREIGLEKIGDSFRHHFTHTNSRTGEVFTDAENLIGVIRGSDNPDNYIVFTAHFDHLGMNDEGEIFNGADDNASGVGGLLATAQYFSENPPSNSIMFISFDAEEQGLGGARYFVENPAVPLEQMIININADMISISDVNEIYAAGTYHYPFLKPLVQEATDGAPVSVLFGHDSPDLTPGDDWTFSSDHGPFHEKGVPFIYFGVEDHPHYHQPTDVFENIHPEFYHNAVRTIINVVRHIDENLDVVKEASDR